MPRVLSPLNAAKEDRFRIILTPPSTVMDKLHKSYDIATASAPFNFNSFTFNVNELNMPSTEIPETAMSFGGGEWKASSHARAKLEPLAVTFEIDAHFINYNTIRQWLIGMAGEEDVTFDETSVFLRHDTERQRAGEEPKMYMGSLMVDVMNDSDRVVATFEFFNVFPTKLAGFKTNYRSEQAIRLSSQVTFHYSHFKWVPAISS